MRKCEPTPRLHHSDCEKLMELTSLLCSGGRSESLRRQLLTSLQQLIPHDLGACHWMQPERHEIAAWYEPQRRSLPVPDAEFWRLIQTHPLNSVLFGQPSRAWLLSDVMPRRVFRQTELYMRLYRPLGVDCELTAVLPDTQHCGKYFLVSLHRREHDFSERDRTVVNLLLPHIARAQHRLALRHDEQSQEASAFASEGEFHEWLRQTTDWELSPRESDVLFWLAQGKTNDEIGTILGISGRTAETHALRIYPKIGVENRYGAITTVVRMMARRERSSIPEIASVRMPMRLRIAG
ncbi:MAG TPA: LuxR C-terminal-related transcriptional regulator [Candidatus Acidoferrum sp.]|nr:LuxR C-terminal-related transcriptional regulator [Candidatus Acidoferrum sp.]